MFSMIAFAVICLLLWLILGFFLVKNWGSLFGADKDNPSETSGARSLGVTHVVVIWFVIAYMLVRFIF